ncbi:MAG: AAA family ATPase [Desulfovibrio sp.]|nr:AAA family ATPase [Desulfovibrio sp.]
MLTHKTCDPRLLPLGNPDFSSIRDAKMVYVDKTELIEKIASQTTPIFFSRPRRFGKSLLINTLHNLFANGLEKFHNLDIENNWHDKTYQVVHFDFSRMASKNAQDLRFSLSAKIIDEFCFLDTIAQTDSQKMQYPDVILDEISKKLTNNSIVLLIDEYDAPLTHHIDDPDELNNITKILNDFYATIKQYTGKYRFIFITGVTRTSHVSLFSAFNNLLDLGTDEEFNALLGFTHDDILNYFDVYVENAAKILQISKNTVYQSLEHYYDGFQFAVNTSETVYNPWSILSFLKLPKNGFKNYWFESGGTPSLLMQYLKINDNFDFLEYNKRNFYIDSSELTRKYEITDIPRNILLYQAGYFTLRAEQDGTVRLVLPNIEVEESLFKIYLTENNLNPSRELRQKMLKLSTAIDSKNLATIINIFNNILNECVSSTSNIFHDERSIRDILYAALIQIPALQKIKERETVKGRSDLELITHKTCMIMELKRTPTAQTAPDALQKAIDQMQRNRYGMLFSQTHSLYRVAMVISTQDRALLPEFCQEIV